MNLADLIHFAEDLGPRVAICGDFGSITYAALGQMVEDLHVSLDVPEGSVVALEGDCSPETIALQLALWARRCIILPLGPNAASRRAEILALVSAEFIVSEQGVTSTGTHAVHPLYRELRTRQTPGLILLTSGTTGEPKVVVHDAGRMLNKISKPGRTQRTLGFLSFDHIGGQNTLLYCLTHGGCFVAVKDRSPNHVLESIEAHGVELLPTSPSFLRLLLVGDALTRHDINSLSLITYGSEPMPETTLAALNAALPGVRKMQQYGMSELGVLRSRSKGDDSTWVKLGGSEFQVRIVDGKLEVKAETAMLGYLNAPSPFTEDGWLQTGDVAEQDGEWIRVLGRRSDVINVGGEKVHPAEVESILEGMDGVLQAVVHREPNALLGNVVGARVSLSTPETPEDFRRRMRAYCGDRMPRHMVPQKVILTFDDMKGFKKNRAS